MSRSDIVQDHHYTHLVRMITDGRAAFSDAIHGRDRRAKSASSNSTDKYSKDITVSQSLATLASDKDETVKESV